MAAFLIRVSSSFSLDSACEGSKSGHTASSRVDNRTSQDFAKVATGSEMDATNPYIRQSETDVGQC